MAEAALPPPAEILAFWFSERARPLWFKRDAAFDEAIRARFAAAVEAAIAGRLGGWEREPESCLALLILLDQFPRNLHRGSPRAFAGDTAARAVARRAIARGLDRRVPADRRLFFYLPFEHSEDPADQRQAVALFRRLAETETGAAREQALEQLVWAERHAAVIERFGRFPHRNAILGRDSTPEELEFLKEPGSSF